MKRLAVGLVTTLWCSAALAHGIGVFADSLGTDCNLVIPYPGDAVTAYVVATIDEDPVACASLASFRIQDLPDGWTGTVSAAGPDVGAAIGNVFAEGIGVAYQGCITGKRLLLVLSITPSSAVDNATLTIAANTNPMMQNCGWEGRYCPQPCPFFCLFNGLGYNCQCADSWPTTLNGAPCVVGVGHSTWGEVKQNYR